MFNVFKNKKRWKIKKTFINVYYNPERDIILDARSVEINAATGYILYADGVSAGGKLLYSRMYITPT